MPTAARLTAAIVFAAIAFLAAETYKPGLPADTQFGRFTLICAIIGMLCGWRVMGRLAGRGYGAALGSGLRTSAATVFYAMLLFAIYAMIGEALRKRYDGVFEAIMGVIDFVLVYGAVLLRPEPMIVLIFGGMAGGLLAEWAGRQWK